MERRRRAYGVFDNSEGSVGDVVSEEERRNVIEEAECGLEKRGLGEGGVEERELVRRVGGRREGSWREGVGIWREYDKEEGVVCGGGGHLKGGKEWEGGIGGGLGIGGNDQGSIFLQRSGGNRDCFWSRRDFRVSDAEEAVVNDECGGGGGRSKLVVDLGSENAAQIHNALHEWEARRREKGIDESEEESGEGRNVRFDEDGRKEIVDGEMDGGGERLLVEKELERGEKEREMRLERRCDVLEVDQNLRVRRRRQNDEREIDEIVGSVVEEKEDLLQNDGVGGGEGGQHRAVLHKLKHFFQVRFPVTQHRCKHLLKFRRDVGSVLIHRQREE